MSDNKQKSGGEGDLPKDSLVEIKTYQFPLILTRTANLNADVDRRCILRYADLRSSFLMWIFFEG